MSSKLTATEYRLLVEHSPVMVWRSGTDGLCDYFNDTWLAFTGRTMEEEAGEGWAQGVHPDDLERCVAYYLDHFRRREPFEMEYRLRRHDGAYRWIFDRGVPFDDDRGAFAGFIGSCVDVDERRQAQDAREKRDREQIASAREFEQWILAIVSHDIRNPLAAIDMSARLLALRSGDPMVRSTTERITRSAGRITRIVGDLLDLSRDRHGGGIPIALATVDLQAVCREVAEEIGAKAPDRKITVECEGDTTGTWDPNRLTQAISNLVGNAVQHSPATSSVAIRLQGGADWMSVAVHNDGAIPPEALPTMFQPFGGGIGRREPSEGLGLGLYIARTIARAHRGNVEAESNLERGTTFRLTLPRHLGLERVARAASTAPPP